MANFKQKSRTCKSDPIVCKNWSIGTHMKVGIGGVTLCIYFRQIMGRSRVEVHIITTINRFHQEGYPQQSLLQLLLLDVSRWKKYLVQRAKESATLVIYRVYCSCKYLEIESSSFLKFQYQATQNILLWNSPFKENVIEFNYLVNFFLVKMGAAFFWAPSRIGPAYPFSW